MTTSREGSTCFPSEPSTKKRFLNNFFTVERYVLEIINDFYLSVDFIIYSLIAVIIVTFLTILFMRK